MSNEVRGLRCIDCGTMEKKRNHLRCFKCRNRRNRVYRIRSGSERRVQLRRLAKQKKEREKRRKGLI